MKVKIARRFDVTLILRYHKRHVEFKNANRFYFHCKRYVNPTFIVIDSTTCMIPYAMHF